MSYDNHDHDYMAKDETIQSNEKKIFLVIVLTFVTMIFEIAFGYWTGSMALLADGWHMGSHVGALGISWLAYRLARSSKIKSYFTFGTGKFVPLAGYTSALLLAIVAFMMIVESIERLLSPTQISFDMAITVAVVGLIVNLLSALILNNSPHHEDEDEHEHEHGHEHTHEHTHDHNHQSAFMHVIADAFTSVLAITALLLGRYFGWNWADPVIGIVGAFVILKWGYGLCKETAWELLDGHAKGISKDKIIDLLESIEGVKIEDLHLWRLAPKAHACEIILSTKTLRGSDFYRAIILEKLELEHLIVEERLT